MPFPILFSLLLAAQSPAPTQPPTSVDGAGAPNFSIPRIEETVVVDGKLDEPAWARATRLTGFSEYRPVEAGK